MKTSVILVFTSICCQLTFAQQIDSSRLQFFPLHLGDEWQYYFGYYDGAPGYTRIFKVVNVDTLLSNGKRYYQLNETRLNSHHIFYHIDSLFEVWETYASPFPDTCLGHISEDNFYRLNEPDSAIWQVCYDKGTLFGPPYLFRYNGISLTEDFGETRELMVFQAGGRTNFGDSTFWSNGVPSFVLMRNLGIYYEEDGEFSFMQLIGAIINGVKYGSLNLVEPQSESIPITFQLFQNYPNPFNGSTTIKYSLPKRSHVLLTVYDVLGREVAVLKNNDEVNGVHSVQFTNNNFPSGIYYYRLNADNVFLTGTMLLLK